MIPRNLSRYIILASSLAFVALASAIPTRTDALATHLNQGFTITKGFCGSEPGGPVVYISNIFDVVPNPRLTSIDTSPLNFAFKNYLVEEYDFKSNSNYPASCGVFQALSQAEANRRQIISQAQQANKQIVELKWNPGPIVAVEQGDTFLIGPKGPPPTHTYCALGHESTMYFSAVFDTTGALVNPKWNDSFNEFLRKTYSAEGEAQCTIMNTVREAERNLKARIGGVRANNHKAVETGWRYNASLVAAKPAPKPTPKADDDPEPAPRPATHTTPPSQSVKDFAAQEGPQVLVYCQKDPMLSKIFDCYRVQRSVYNYRMEHGSSEPLASLFKQEKVNLAEAIGTGLNLWVRERATSQGLGNRVINCIEQKFNVSFYDKPYISQMQKIYDTSVAACKP